MKTSRLPLGGHRWTGSAMRTSEGHSCVGGKVRAARPRRFGRKDQRGNLRMSRKGMGGGWGGGGQERRKGWTVLSLDSRMFEFNVNVQGTVELFSSSSQVLYSVRLGSFRRISSAFHGPTEGRIRVGEDKGRDEETERMKEEKQVAAWGGTARESDKRRIF